MSSDRSADATVAIAQITVRARDCQRRPRWPPFIGDVLTYRGQEWTIVGLFVGADPITSEVEEYLVLEGHGIEEQVHEADGGRGERGRAL